MSQDQHLKMLADFLDERLRMRAPRIPGNQQDVAIRDTLRGLSDSWDVVPSGSTSREYALPLLLQSGLAEARIRYPVRMRGSEEVLDVTIRACGWVADVDVEWMIWDVLPKHWTDEAGDPRPEVYFEGGGVLTEARLTICGLNARHDIEGGGELATVALNWAAKKLHLPEWRVEKVEVQLLAANGGQQANPQPASDSRPIEEPAVVQEAFAGSGDPPQRELTAFIVDAYVRDSLRKHHGFDPEDDPQVKRYECILAVDIAREIQGKYGGTLKRAQRAVSEAFGRLFPRGSGTVTGYDAYRRMCDTKDLLRNWFLTEEDCGRVFNTGSRTDVEDGVRG